MGIGKTFFGASNTGCPGTDTPVDTAIPLPDGAVCPGKRTLASQFQKASFITEFFGHNSIVQIIAVDAPVMDGSAEEKFEPSGFIKLFRGRHAVE
jgi:hypothetical protein